MNISDMNSEIIFPLKLFVALTTRNRLHFPVYGEGVSVESTLVFTLEVTRLALKTDTPMISESVSHQHLPLLECFWTFGTSENVVCKPEVGLKLGRIDMLEGTELTVK